MKVWAESRKFELNFFFPHLTSGLEVKRAGHVYSPSPHRQTGLLLVEIMIFTFLFLMMKKGNLK